MSIVAMFKGVGPSGFGYGSTSDQVVDGLDLSGRTYLITGCNSGLGLDTVRVLASRGATLLGAARTEAKARGAGEALGVDLVPIVCDLAEPASVYAAVDAVAAWGKGLDGIIANAGIMALPKLEQKYGYELQFFTNHIGHFILVTGLLSQLRDGGRVVMLSSTAHRRAPASGIELDNLSGACGYGDLKMYGQSKLANLLFARALATRLEGTGKTANALHPGVIMTNLFRHMGPFQRTALRALGPLALKSIPQGGATQAYVAAHPGAAGVSGEYWADCNVAVSTPNGQDMALAEALWAKSEEIVAGLPRT